jgi:hypothetical protein
MGEILSGYPFILRLMEGGRDLAAAVFADKATRAKRTS